MIRSLMERWFRVRNKHEALHLRRRIALIYAFVGWNCFGVLFYVIMKKELPEDSEKRRAAFGLLSGIPTNMHVYQVTGMTLTNDFDIAYKAKVAQIEKENEESKNAAMDEH